MAVARPAIPKRSLDTFIDALSAGATVNEACQKANIAYRTAYNYRRDDEGFAERWRLAREQGFDELERELVVRAKDRNDPQSASLLKFALAGYRRQTFGQHVQVDAKVTAVPIADARRLQELAAAQPDLTVGELTKLLGATA